MMGVLSLGVPTKATLEIVAEGEDEKQAITVIKETLNQLEITKIE